MKCIPYDILNVQDPTRLHPPGAQWHTEIRNLFTSTASGTNDGDSRVTTFAVVIALSRLQTHQPTFEMNSASVGYNGTLIHALHFLIGTARLRCLINQIPR